MPLIALPGIMELIIIFGVVFLLFGAKKLPALGGAIGESIKNFKKGVKEPDDKKLSESGSEPGTKDRVTPNSLFSRRLLLVTGKGGIGKSLVAASLGQLAADAGRKTLIVESASLDQLAPLFGGGPTGHVVTPVRDNLATINLHPPDNFKDYVVKHLGQRQLFEKVFSHKVVQSFINTVPGLAELMMLGRLYYECELAPGPRHDLVIFDGSASGHFLSLMTTPDAVLAANLGGPLAWTERVRAFLADPAKVGTLYVAVPEDLVVSETLDFLPRLAAKSPAKLTGLVMNRVPTWGETGLGSGAAAGYLARRAKAASAAMQDLKTGLVKESMNLPMWILPELGFVEEPLPAGFAGRFMSAEAGA